MTDSESRTSLMHIGNYTSEQALGITDRLHSIVRVLVSTDRVCIFLRQHSPSYHDLDGGIGGSELLYRFLHSTYGGGHES